jgi:nucleoside-diphosphate-sugar epimerase
MAGEEERKRVLVVGGSGYLGQHLLAALAASSAADCLDVAFTHHSSTPPQPLLDALPSVRADLCSGDGFEAISASFGQVHTRSHSHRAQLSASYQLLLSLIGDCLP